MSAAAAERPRTRPRRRVSGRLIGAALVVLVVVAMALDTTYKDPDEAITTGGRPVRPAAIRRGDLPEGGLDARGERAAPARARGRAREGRGRGRRAVRQPRGQQPVRLPGHRRGRRRQGEGRHAAREGQGRPEGCDRLGAGRPRAPGHGDPRRGRLHRVRPVRQPGRVRRRATALNNQVKAQVLEDLDPASLEGKKVQVLQAFTYLAPTVVTITPVKLEAAS